MSEDTTLDEFINPDSDGADLKSTPTGNYSSDWPIVRNGEHVSLRNGGFLKSDDRDENAQYPVYGGNGIMGYTSDTNVSEGTIVIGRVGAYCGNVHQTNSKAWVTDNSIILTNETSTYSNKYLKYLLTDVELGQFSEQSAQPRISQSTVENIRIPQPPLPEQRKIATVLYNVDQAIQKTEEMINHTKRLREALLNELLVSGYNENRATQEGYIGPRKVEYPRDWLSVELGDLTDKITKGKTPTSYGYDYTDSGINFVKVESISDYGSIDTSEFDYIGEDAHEHLSGSALEEGDILFSIAGALGKVTQMNKELLPANTNQALALIRVDDSRAIPEYIRYYLETTLIQKYIQSIATTTAQSNLNLKQVSEFKILLPEVNEQEKILQIIYTIEEKLRCEESQKEQYQRLKQGLMQDLLSGTVRTTNTNIEVPEEIAQHG